MDDNEVRGPRRPRKAVVIAVVALSLGAIVLLALVCDPAVAVPAISVTGRFGRDVVRTALSSGD